MFNTSTSGSYSGWLPAGNPTPKLNLYLPLLPDSIADPSSAYALAPLGGSRTIEQYVGQFSPRNYYQFQLNSSSDFNATISNYSPVLGGLYSSVLMGL